MLSKCANSDCSEQFRYLNQGKIFYLAPTPEVQIAMGMPTSSLQERFWLCARCASEMTLIWNGGRVKPVRLPTKTEAVKAPSPQATGHHRRRGRLRSRPAPFCREDR